MFNKNHPIRLDRSSPPRLIIVVDAEEEFDWNAGPDRSANGVSAMDSIHLVQDIFDEYGIIPCYVIDYPVVSQEEGRARLVNYFRQGRCEIGAHLHPWVNPPHVEEVNSFNSYAGNLPPELEYEKLQFLRDTIAAHFGESPRIYKAGRYGIGPNTQEILHKLGFEVDLSLCPGFDYRDDGGPDFSAFRPEPFWFGAKQDILEIPVTGAFVGWAGKYASFLHRFGGRLEQLRARGILARLGAVDRLMLSPEGYSFEEQVKITRHLMDRGVRIFTWNFHSSSLGPGFTQYVRNGTELEIFLDSFHSFFDFFFNELGGIAATPLQIRTQLEELR